MAECCVQIYYKLSRVNACAAHNLAPVCRGFRTIRQASGASRPTFPSLGMDSLYCWFQTRFLPLFSPMVTRNVTRVLYSALVLFALSSLAGILPLAAALLVYHGALSAREMNRVRAERWLPYVKGIVVGGYVVFLAMVVLILVVHSGRFSF